MAEILTKTVEDPNPPPRPVDATYYLDEQVLLDGDAGTPQYLEILTGGVPAPAITLNERLEPGVGEETVVQIIVRAYRRTK